jgi:hypothetical protein
MPVVVFPNEKVVRVRCPNKSGISTVTDILGYPFFNNFRARGGRSELIKGKKWFKEINDPELETLSIDVNIAVLRDPVSRLASCYADRVLKKNRNGSRDEIPSWDYFVRNLEDIQSKYKDLFIHSRTQLHWLGEDPSMYDYVFNTKQLSVEFASVISKTSGVDIPTTSHRKSSRGLSNSFNITDEHRKIIKEFYADEYRIWGDYFQ